MRSRDEIKSFLRGPQKDVLGERAMEFAKFAHDGQRDRGGHPYIGHIERVSERAKEVYADPILTAIAILHDTVEDGGFTISDLMMFFPDVVWKVVSLLTRGKTVPRDKYIEAIAGNYLAARVKICDLEDNIDITRISNPSPKDYERRDRYLAEYRILQDSIIDWERRLPKKDLETETYAACYL